MALVKSEELKYKLPEPLNPVSVFENLHCEDAELRREAALALGESEKKSRAVRELFEQLEDEDNCAVRQAIFSSLQKINNDEVVLGAMDLLESEDATLRNDAIDLLKTMPDLIGPYMVGILQHENPDVRIFAVNILESLKHPNVVNWLIDVINKDSHVNVCATAVDLLAEVGDKRARVPLARLEERFADEPFIAFSVSSALERIAA